MHDHKSHNACRQNHLHQLCPPTTGRQAGRHTHTHTQTNLMQSSNGLSMQLCGHLPSLTELTHNLPFAVVSTSWRASGGIYQRFTTRRTHTAYTHTIVDKTSGDAARQCRHYQIHTSTASLNTDVPRLHRTGHRRVRTHTHTHTQ